MTAPLVQLRAGKLILDGGVLRPDARKGLIRVNRDEHDLLHFQWGERDAAGALVGELEIDQIIFPGEASFEKVDNSLLRTLRQMPLLKILKHLQSHSRSAIQAELIY